MGYSYHAQGRYREAETVLLQNVERLEEVRPKDGSAATLVSYVSSTGWLAFSLAELGEIRPRHLLRGHGPAGCRVRAPRLRPGHRLDPGGWWRCAVATWTRRCISSNGAWRACLDKQLTVWRPLPSSLLGLTRARVGRPEDALPLLEDGVRLTEELG